MADQSTLNDLPYGHFGNPEYDEKAHQFHVPRKLGVRYFIDSVDAPPLYSARPDAGQKGDLAQGPSTRRTRQIHDLTRRHPELQPATELLPHLLHVSEATEEACARYDATKGSLLAAGRLSDRTSHQVIQVIAFASGISGGDICVAQLHQQRQGWSDSPHAWVEVPSIRGRQVIWRGPGAPIRQITFAQPANGTGTTSYLAIRLHDRTLIFRPRVSPSESDQLDLSDFVSITIEDIHGVPHADVAFNPWRTQQLGVIDQAGSWSIWELDGRSTLRARCTSRHHEDTTTRTQSHLDGWVRIVWVGGPRSVAICTRNQVELFNTAAEDVEPQGLDIKLESGMILDVRVSPKYPMHLFVLTSTHILLFRIQEVENGAIVKKTLQLRHYRNPEDFSLHLTLLTDQEDIVVSLRSRWNRQALCHRIIKLDSQQPQVHDPSTFRLPGETDLVQYLDTILQPLNYNSLGAANVENTTFHTYKQLGLRFIQAMSLTDDFNLQTDLLYEIPEKRKAIDIKRPLIMKAPDRARGKTGEEKFIVDDDEVDVIYRARPRSVFAQRMTQHHNGKHDLKWTISYAKSAASLEEPRDNARSVDVNDILRRAKNILQKGEASVATPIRDLLQLEDAEISVLDLDESSSLLQALLSPEMHVPPPIVEEDDFDVESTAQLVIRQISLPLNADLGQARNLIAMYDSIVATWITALSSSVSGRVRIAKEQLARRVAAEVTLASHVVRIAEDTADEVQATAIVDNPAHQFELPVRGAQATNTTGPCIERSTQSVLPTPSPTATPSVTTGSSFTSTVAAPEMSRLLKYTSFSKPLPAPLPRTAQRLLNHWSVGSDPSTYDWQATSRRITRQVEDEEADSQLTEKERARVRRKAERHIKRQRREVAASQQHDMASSQLPELVVSASQPTYRPKERSHTQPNASAIVHPGSSQSMEALTASQAVPGRYGGRPAKKRRKQGF